MTDSPRRPPYAPDEPEPAAAVRASTAIRVVDVKRSLAFFRDGLGFPVVARDDAEDVAVVDGVGFMLLLAGPRAGKAGDWLREDAGFVRPGTTVHFSGGDAANLDGLLARLSGRGVNARIETRPWGDRSLETADPDGYAVSFWTPTTLSQRDVIARYVAGPDELEAALAGLPARGLDLRLNPDRTDLWSIRQIVHHLSDMEAAGLERVKMAIAEPGRYYAGNRFDPDRWADALNYYRRPVKPSVALFRAIREHVSDLMNHFPDAWDRATTSPNGSVTPVRMTISMLMSHACEHIEDIQAIRERHCV